ncbi:MAG: class I SAM-dependent methyltransferase [Chloroherpetonaceae bacterium]|nr:class I SAM-dependent methyltransferase [Chloroherpetonaceae bacterium]
MQYDPIKRSLGKVFGKTPFLRKVFYRLLDWLFLRTWYVHRELKAWAKAQQNGACILDAGAGFGQYVYFLSRLNPAWQILAVDVKAEQVEDCNRFFQAIGKQNVTFKTADLTAFCQPDAFDLVLTIDVMEHIEDDIRVFKNLFNSMKKGGLLIISTPSDKGGSDAQHSHEEPHNEAHGFIDEHVRDGYSIEDIQQKLATAGFQRIEAHYTYGKPGSIAWRLSIKYPIQLLGISQIFFVLLPVYYLFVYPIALVLNYLDMNITH